MIDDIQPAFAADAAALNPGLMNTAGETTGSDRTDPWSAAPDTAELHVTIPGKPGEMLGTIGLVEDGGRTTETVDVTIKVHLPLVGGRIEGLIADLLRKALDAENSVGRDYLSG